MSNGYQALLADAGVKISMTAQPVAMIILR